MLRNASVISGCAIAASDGQIGTVSDFLFDDATWLIRWLVVDTGNWLPGREVLLPASALGHLEPLGRKFAVRLTMQQVKASPDVDTDRPVSRQMETDIYGYYGWSPYWGTGFSMGGGMAPPPDLGFRQPEAPSADTRGRDDDPHLRSSAAVTGYHVHASDGEIGHVEDFLVEEEDWRIHYLVIDTKNWWPAKKVLISPRSVREIDWADKLVNLNVDRQRVKDSPAYDASTMVDAPYEKHFHSYYGYGGPSTLP
jgi:hypothetical protein